jgi:hypothetical protein
MYFYCYVLLYVYAPIVYLCIYCMFIYIYCDRLCGLVVRVSGYRYIDPEFDSRRYQIF